MKNRFRVNKIPNEYLTLDRAGQVILIRLRTGRNRFNSHMHRSMNLVPSPLCASGKEYQTTEHILQIYPSFNISENNYGMTEQHYIRGCMGRKKN